jgi:hypothetical protein
MAHEWIHKLNESDSRLHKEAVLGAALGLAKMGDLGAIRLLSLLRACYDPFVTFGVKQVGVTEGITGADNPWSEFSELLVKLSKRQLTGHAARDAIVAISTRFDSVEWNVFCRPVILKDIRAGISEKTINKVCKGSEFEIPVFGCQLATSCDDRPEMKGIKRLEPKLDGCLSANWFVEFEDGTKVTIAEVVESRIEGKVKSFNTHTGEIEYNNILGWAKDGKDDKVDEYEWFEIELESGKTLPPLTGNHLVYLPLLDCYRRVDLLTTDDCILENI